MMKTNSHLLPALFMPSLTSVFLFHKLQVICFTLAVKQVLNFPAEWVGTRKKVNYCIKAHSLEDKIICLKYFSHCAAPQLKANEISHKHKGVSVLEWSETRTTNFRTQNLLWNDVQKKVIFLCDVHIS